MEKLIFIVLFLSVVLAVSSENKQIRFDHIESKPAYNIDGQIRSIFFRPHIPLKTKDETLLDRFQNIEKILGGDENNINSMFQNATKCIRDVKYISQNLKTNWALKMLDSFGKPESGIMIGNLKMLGEYNECMEIHAPRLNSTSDLVTGDFHGQYCTLSAMSMVTLGVCVPDSCTSEIQSIFKLLSPIDENNLPSNNSLVILSDCKPRERQLNGPSKAVIALLSLFSALVIVGSSVTVAKYFHSIFLSKGSRNNSLIINVPQNDLGSDFDDQLKRNIIQNKDDDLLLHDRPSQTLFQKIEPFFECFCVFKNGSKLLNTDTSEGELLCIHGIRFLSMSWVILGHSYAFVFGQTRNLLEIVEATKGFAFQIILQGFYSVDSFFVLSGFLMTYLCMQQLTKSQGSMNWAYFYIHRYIRLTPVYMVVLGFSASLFLYFGSGPFWPSNDLDANCVKYWWYNLLYINNFTSLTKQCMGWSWYLANDMQFFVISPIILILLWRWPKVGYSLLALLLGGCFIANFYLTYHYDLVAGIAGMMNLSNPTVLEAAMARMMDYMDKLYIKPYTRIAPYLVGMLTGYLLHIRKKNNSSKHSLLFLCVGWIVATTSTLATVYGQYHQETSTLSSSFYNALSRTVWGMGLSWVIYVCLVDQGGFVNAILSYKFFIPLSRLTYAAYLIHPLIITGYYTNLKTSFEFAHPSVVLLFLGIMVVTYALALPVVLILESPIITVEKLIRKRFAKRRE